MDEALEIMRRLLDGEKLDFSGDFYTVDKGRLYSPPISRVPIWMAAGGPKSATFAGKNAVNSTRFVGQRSCLFHAATSSWVEANASRGVLCPWRWMSHSLL